MTDLVFCFAPTKTGRAHTKCDPPKNPWHKLHLLASNTWFILFNLMSNSSFIFKFAAWIATFVTVHRRFVLPLRQTVHACLMRWMGLTQLQHATMHIALTWMSMQRVMLLAFDFKLLLRKLPFDNNNNNNNNTNNNTTTTNNNNNTLPKQPVF